MTLFNTVMQGQADRFIFVDAKWEGVAVSDLNASANDDSLVTRRYYYKYSANSRDYIKNFEPVPHMAVKIFSEELSLHEALKNTLLQRVKFFYVEEPDNDPYTLWSRVIIPTIEYIKEIKTVRINPCTLPPTVNDLAERVEKAIGGLKKNRTIGVDFILIGDIPISIDWVNRYHLIIGKKNYPTVAKIICTLAEHLSLDKEKHKRKKKNKV